jgi:uncharacterized protein (DUF1810 family)
MGVPTTDLFDPERFVEAQAPVYAQVVAELAQGRKRSHWIWFIFPQIVGLGFSAMAQHFAIASREEAVAYLKHEVLGPRLIECVNLVLAVEGRTINEILGSPDDLKFRSSMTLFKSVSDNPVFSLALRKFYAGAEDARTLEILNG